MLQNHNQTRYIFFNVGDEPTKGKLPLSSTKEAGRFPLPIKFAMSFISENSYLLSIFTFFLTEVEMFFSNSTRSKVNISTKAWRLMFCCRLGCTSFFKSPLKAL